MGLAVEDLAYCLLNCWHPRHPADEDDLVDIICGEICILKRLLTGSDRAFDKVIGDLLKLRSSKCNV